MINLIKNSVDKDRIGNQVKTVEEVIKQADNKKCLVYRGGRVPAAFLQNFYSRHLYNELRKGVIFYYRTKK